MAGEGLPAAVAVGEDVGEADTGNDFAIRIDDFIQSARETGVVFDVGAHFGEPVGPGLSLRDLCQRLSAGVDRAVDVGVFKFVGEDAGDGIGVFVGESVGPVALEFNKGGLCLGLVLGAFGGKGG